MLKYSHIKRIFPLCAIMMFILFTISTFSAPEISHKQTTEDKEESTSVLTPCSISPMKTAAQAAVPTSKTIFTIGGFEFRICEVVFCDTAGGFVPLDMGVDDQVMFVEFELLSGKKEVFQSLHIRVKDSSGQKSNAFILASGGTMQMLSAVNMKSASSEYQPKKDNIAWAYLVKKDVNELYLNFPTGEVIELMPLIKEFRY
jgi:hypothetical protein